MISSSVFQFNMRGQASKQRKNSLETAGRTKSNTIPILIALTASVPIYTTIITTISSRQRRTQIVSGQQTCQSSNHTAGKSHSNPHLMWHMHWIGLRERGQQERGLRQTGDAASCWERQCLGVCFNPLWLVLMMMMVGDYHTGWKGWQCPRERQLTGYTSQTAHTHTHTVMFRPAHTREWRHHTVAHSTHYSKALSTVAHVARTN